MAVRDVLFAGVIFFVLGTTFFIVNFASNKLFDSMISIGAINESTHAVEVFEGTQRNVINRLDYIIFGLFVGLLLGIMITAWYIGGEPLFTYIYVIIWVLAVVFCSIESLVWDTIKNHATFVTANTLSHFPLTNQLLTFLPIYIAVFGFIGIIIMFAKQGQGQ